MSNVKETIEAVQGIVESVPVYEDMLQPATKELGKGLLTISKVVNIALSPLSGLDWGYEKIAKFLESSMAEKLKDIPEENITTPSPSVAVPAIEALRYTGDIEELREMFSNLIATAMDKKASNMAHPAFVEVIKQLSSDEAKLIRIMERDAYPLITVSNHFKDRSYSRVMKNFTNLAEKANCESPTMIFSYLENLSRLGLISIEEISLKDESLYQELLDHSAVIDAKQIATKKGELDPKVDRDSFWVTPFGKQFITACVKN